MRALIASLLLSVAVAVPASAEVTAAGQKAMVAAGKIMFDQRCHVCHSENPETASYGPTLKGIIGRQAGSVEGFEYSDALTNSGIVWTEESLRAWIANNTAMMPGTRMRHVGIDDKAEQDFLIAYLRSISE